MFGLKTWSHHYSRVSDVVLSDPNIAVDKNGAYNFDFNCSKRNDREILSNTLGKSYSQTVYL